MSEKVSCPGCGAQVAATGVCRFCGSTALIDGVAGKLLPSDLACPRCPGSPPLGGVEHEGFRADLCMKCHGVWFGLGLLEEAIRTAVKRPAKKGEGGEGPVHGGVEPVRYARCPRCGGGMTRAPLARKPLVIIDRCPCHGDWCDGGELSQLKAVARARGVKAAMGADVEAKGPRASPAKTPAPGAGSGLAVDPLIAELRNRPGNWGIVPSAVSAADARKARARGGLFGRRRPRRDLFDVLWSLLDLP